MRMLTHLLTPSPILISLAPHGKMPLHDVMQGWARDQASTVLLQLYDKLRKALGLQDKAAPAPRVFKPMKVWPAEFFRWVMNALSTQVGRATGNDPNTRLTCCNTKKLQTMQAGVLYTLHMSHETCLMTLPWCVVLHPLACTVIRAPRLSH